MSGYSKEKTITCPYNVAHQIRPERIQYHLVKCRQNHPKVDHVICPYNATHHVPRPEEQYHISTCSDRKIVEMSKYSWIYDKPGQQGNLTNPPPNSANIPVEEDQPPTAANEEKCGMKGFGDIRESQAIPLRRPTVVAEEAKMAEASQEVLQEHMRPSNVAANPSIPLRRPAK